MSKEAKPATDLGAELAKIDEMLPSKQFTAIRFREGDLIELPDCGLVLEMATYKGCRELRVPKSAGAKVRKKP